MERLQIPQKLVHKIAVVKKNYVHEIAAVSFSKIYLLINAKKTCKPNNCDSNCNWIKSEIWLNSEHLFLLATLEIQ